MTQKTANHHPDLPHPCNLLQLHSLLEKVERPRQPQYPLEAGWLGEDELLLVVGQWVSSWVGAVVVYVQIYGGVPVVEPACTQVFVVTACRDSAPWDQHKNMQGGLILFF